MKRTYSTYAKATRRRHFKRRLVAVLSCAIVLVTALALMEPVFGVSKDVATQESGFFMESQDKAMNAQDLPSEDAVSADASSKESASSKTSVRVQALNEENAQSNSTKEEDELQARTGTTRDDADDESADDSSKQGEARKPATVSAQADNNANADEERKPDASTQADDDSSDKASADDSRPDETAASSSAAGSPAAAPKPNGDANDERPEASSAASPDVQPSIDTANDQDASKPASTPADEAPANSHGSSDSNNPSDTAATDTSAANEEAAHNDEQPRSSDSAASAPVEPMPAQSFEKELVDGNGKTILKVSARAPKGAFASGTTMEIEEVPASEVKDQVQSVVENSIKQMTAVDITFFDKSGNKVEPAKNIEVKITSKKVREIDEPVLVHIIDKQNGEKPSAAPGEPGTSDDAEIVQGVQVVNADESNKFVGAEDTLKFRSDAFSIYVIVETTIETNVLASDGHNYKIAVTCGPEANVPEDAQLAVEELDGNAYEDYFARAATEMGVETFDYARIFDISIADADGNHIQPEAPVAVKVELLDASSSSRDFSVVHFNEKANRAETPEQITAETSGNTVSFSAQSFSAYAIVQGPEANTVGWVHITSIADLNENASTGLYIGTTTGYYLTSDTALGSQDASTTGIVKTKPAQSTPPTSTAALYYFEAVPNANNQYYVYCLGDQDEKLYVRNTGDQNLYLVDQEERTAFEIIVENDGRFRLRNGNRYWNMWNGANANHIAAWTSATDTNNYFYLWKYVEAESDPYGLDGASYGLMNWIEGTTGKAMMAESSASGSLDALPLTVMAKTGNNSDKLFVPNDSDISLWTFNWVENDKYYLSANVDGSRKYLKIAPSGITLVDQPDEACKIQVTPGTGAHTGEIFLKVGDTALTYSGKVATGFKTGGAVGSEWLKLVEVSELTSDYFLTYSASKVGVSDESVTNGSRIIMYTRVWNESKLKYDFYAVDHDGSLVPCYESGDSIQWVGSLLNSMLWNFVEYYWDGTNDPNYYYELYNQYSENYIAPQVSDGQIFSDAPIGINLNGRKNGQYYTPIMAWDDENYSYVGLKADVATGKVVSCPRSEADDFYFAIMQDMPVDDELITVPTVDSAQYGITMKIADFANRDTMSNYLGSNAGGAVDNTDPNLLSTNLVNGYPTTKAGNSLSDWFTGPNAREVNHLFIQSTYSATGYFEYDSTQNFASLQGNDFVVYKEIGTVNSGGVHYQHGQFFPFNNIKPGVFATTSPKNLTTAGGKQLPETDPRKYEQLYLVQNPNYYLGMEIEASFTQTPNGLDDWGHDIIYEFTGDDDFWLYVDGELIIDLGGIHNALSGSVNYKTGVVIVNGQRTTLRQLFENNFRTRNPNATDAEVAAFLNEYFDEGSTIFRDYTSHTMKIFYLERGAGASNLHMRFNLASIKPGTVQLDKKLSGVDHAEAVLAEFPYQIKYKKKNDPTEYYLTNAVGNDPQRNTDYVFYKDTTAPVTYTPSFTVDGVAYNDVFLLKPDETAEINFPTFGVENETIDSYTIVECGVNTSIYSNVRANNQVLKGTSGAGYAANRKDFGMNYATTGERARVTYDNEVDPNALRTLSIRKRLLDEHGVNEISAQDDSNTFDFRLYMDTEFHNDPDAADMHTYHVKDPNGHYCTRNATTQSFDSTETTNYNELTDEQKKAVSFTTSMNGSISKIPAGYTVEVRNVLAGTKFKVVERPTEIPDGYSFQKYAYNAHGYSGNTTDALTGVSDTIVSKDIDSAEPLVDVFNLKGWGLRVNKAWSDNDYMSQRDATYFAVFTGETEEDLTLVDGTLRQLPYGESSLYWYFLPLPVDVPFDNYEIREVKLTNPTVGEDGYVTSYGSMEPIAPEGKLEINGTQKGETTASQFEYTVLYDRGTVSQESNVRVDSVTNNRSGIELRKQDWAGNPLAGAKFTLTDEDGNLIGSFTSDDAGHISTAFLRDDVDYTLAETNPPKGYRGLEAPMTIRLSNGAVTVNGVDESSYILEQQVGTTPTLTVKNRPIELKVVKIGVNADGSSTPLAGVPFELHREVTVDGVTSMELNPLVGYENMVSAPGTGIVEQVNQELHDPLHARTFYLVEKAAPDGYLQLNENTKFTVNENGTVTLADTSMAELETQFDEMTGLASYTIRVKNLESAAAIRIVKVDQSRNPVEGAKFSISGSGIEARDDLESKIPAGGSEAEIYTNANVPVGTYTLTETGAPDGYNSLEAPVIIKVKSTTSGISVSASINGAEIAYPDVAQDRDTGIWTIKVVNQSGLELPNTGGPGTHLPTLIGGILVLGAAAYLWRSRKPDRLPQG